VLTGSEQADRSRTRRRPDFCLVNAIARLLVTASLLCHERTCGVVKGSAIAIATKTDARADPEDVFAATLRALRLYDSLGSCVSRVAPIGCAEALVLVCTRLGVDDDALPA
jgi:hypothetical protein